MQREHLKNLLDGEGDLVLTGLAELRAGGLSFGDKSLLGSLGELGGLNLWSDIAWNRAFPAGDAGNGLARWELRENKLVLSFSSRVLKLDICDHTCDRMAGIVK